MTYIHTQPWALYNEIDEYAAEWIENLIAKGLVAPGIVDRRSIEDITPDELRGFRQFHTFAGIAVWSHSLRRAGVSDDTALWTGSCPCQPFSAAGKGGGVDDERHLWPAFYHLIRECRPPKVYGEQVASKDGLGWLDVVSSDMERAGYAFGAVDTCSAGHGAPHIRQRLRFVAHDLRSSAGGIQHTTGDRWLERGSEPIRGSATSGRSPMRMADLHEHGRNKGRISEPTPWNDGLVGDCASGGLDNNDDEGLEGFGSGHQTALRHGQGSVRPASASGELGGMADTASSRQQHEQSAKPTGILVSSPFHTKHGSELSRYGASGYRSEQPSPTNGFWRGADWLFCRDGRWRPVEPGSFPLAHGAPSRVGRLRAYGNAVDAEATREFIEATLESETLDLVAAGTLFEDILG